jgi:CheY-like chemotaxis protein
MLVKILLADKSITIQKVVEMLFSGKEYEVTCVSDGDSAFSEASRIVPDVVLADVDLPRIDGYSFAGRLKETPTLAKVPVILMLSRDDVYDAMKGKLSGIVDNIAKPFESQELIGKVKKAISTAPAAAPASPHKPAVEPVPPPKPVAAPPPAPKPVAAPVPAPPSRTRDAVPTDIFDIIEEAPVKAEVKEAPASPPSPKQEMIAKTAEPEEGMFEVEPEYEVEPELELEPEKPVTLGSPKSAAAPEAKGEWAALMAEAEPERMPAPEPQAAALEAFDTDQLFGREPVPAEEFAPLAPEPVFGTEVPRTEPDVPPSFDFSEPLPVEAEEALPLGQRAMDEMRAGLGLGEETAYPSAMHPDIVSFESLDMASRASHEDYTFASPEAELASKAAVSPRVPEASDEMFKGIPKESIEKAMREVLERVAWEVIPDLAERLIREEIERLKAETN